ncbi:MAG TPA: aminotransferase class I/II-fold pyridoxal phosphate-dependent enzyme [Tepidisphaeraceae bacterium]|nr:aminotransferase class I/II-fold pyridoxal phosphate-dependent enzyme [Tepidisphaeraceae bacterium]
MWDDVLESDLRRRRDARLLRARRVVRPIDAAHVEIEGVGPVVNFCSNNYLGLTHHPAVVQAVARAARAHGAGSGAAGLISGHTVAHEAAEVAIARWKATEAAVLLPSGYQANHAVVQSLAGVAEAQGRAVRFLLDKLCHASLVDAVRGSGAPYRVFPHNGLDKLRRLLADAPADELQVVVTESIFSMDGDAADLTGLAALKRDHPFFLIVDEAHASGVYGLNGAGLVAELGLSGIADAMIVTLSKAAGVGGGAVCGSRTVRDAVLNAGRAYVYSTNVPPMIAAGAEAAVAVMAAEPQRQHRVRALATRVRATLAARGVAVQPGPVDSPIIPVLLETESAALAAADSLLRSGLFVVAVRPPTVPKGTSRLRITVSAAHSDAEVERLLGVLPGVVRRD